MSKWCPKCHRLNVEYNPSIKHEMCTWKDCYWINKNDIDLDKAFELYIEINGTQFKKFEKTLKHKKVIGV